ncbi:MAG: class I mannose-6-phosphate isomerase [Bacteroidales bacterium]
MKLFQSNFNKRPAIRVSENADGCYTGWEEIFKVLLHGLDDGNEGQKTIVVECYQGVYFNELLNGFVKGLKPNRVITSNDYFLPESDIDTLTFPDVTDDRVFGFLTRLNMVNFVDRETLNALKEQVYSYTNGITLIFGYGATLVADNPSVLVYADMPRWEIQLRMRNNRVCNLGLNNRNESIESKYKRGYFVDWRVCDRHKKKLMQKWDFVLDSTNSNKPIMLAANAFNKGLSKAITQPFSVVPYFDQGPWGGQWMKKICALDPEPDNYAWCFNCIPEENSLLLAYGNVTFETPSINLVFAHPKELLGEAVHARFGDEFPIRFDYLDTMGGGNLSLQVHPITEYIQEKFGIHYTQDESYYLLDAADDASVYLGLKEGVNPEKMVEELVKAESGEIEFDAEKHVMKWPAKKHDHFLIPGGTIHCSGRNSLVLEVSSTPYIFTFKLWDWGRLGLDGKPRPINIEHGKNVIQWDRTERWTRKNLINQFKKIDEGDGWTEEVTGLHEREFIETRRHWFTKPVAHYTNGGVNVLALVEGREIIVESPRNTFSPFIIHYAEVFIVPAYITEYTIRPYGESEGKRCATIKAFVRT